MLVPCCVQREHVTNLREAISGHKGSSWRIWLLQVARELDICGVSRRGFIVRRMPVCPPKVEMQPGKCKFLKTCPTDEYWWYVRPLLCGVTHSKQLYWGLLGALSTPGGLITVLYYREGGLESFLFLFLQVVLNSQGVHPTPISHPETFNCWGLTSWKTYKKANTLGCFWSQVFSIENKLNTSKYGSAFRILSETKFLQGMFQNTVVLKKSKRASVDVCPLELANLFIFTHRSANASSRSCVSVKANINSPGPNCIFQNISGYLIN